MATDKVRNGKRESLLCKHKTAVIIAGLLAGLVSGFGYAADDGSSTSDVLETPDALLEYVESSRTQFIDTGICPKTGTKTEVKVQFKDDWSTTTTAVILGTGKHGGSSRFWMPAAYNKYMYAGCGSVQCYIEYNHAGGPNPTCSKLNGQINHSEVYTFTTEMTTDGKYNVTAIGGKFDGGYVYRDVSVQGDFLSSPNPMYLFGANENGSLANGSSIRCYGAKIWQTNGVDGAYVLLRDFRPCKRYNRAAMWDAVSGKIFFSGSGTDLTAGPVVTPQFERKAVKYVESTGSQYINTGVCPKTGTKSEVKVRWRDTSNGTKVILGTGSHGTPSGKRFWFGATYGSYLYAGCGNVQCYMEYKDGNGVTPTYSKLNNKFSSSTDYIFTVEMTTNGFYNVSVQGGTLNGGYCNRDVSSQGFLYSTNSMYLFGANENGALTQGAKAYCYGAKIWQTNGVDGTYVLLRDLTPCQKEGRAGMYDAVNDEILYSGSGTDLVIGGAAVWNNTSGDNLFDNPANWSTGAVPTDGDVATVNVSGEMTLIVTNHYALSRLSVTGSGTLAFVGNGSLYHKRLDIASGATVVRTGLAGLVDGGLTGAGTFVLDPGTGNSLTMTQSNTGFTGTAVINSGTVKFGNATSFGPINRSSFIRVRNGGTLDTGNVQNGSNTGEKNKVILEEGATLAANPGLDHNITSHQWSLITTLTLEGDATIDTSHGDVSMGLKWHDAQVKLNLGGNTLTVKGNRAFSISYCLISGTGKIDIQEGATVWSTQDYDNVDVSTTFSEGTIHIHEGAGWSLLKYYSSSPARLSVKNLILDGAVTRAVNTYTLTVTGSITGKGTTPTLTMGSGAVFKPSGTGYLTVTESFSGTMMIDASGLDLESTYDRVPLFKVGSEEMLSSVPVDFVAGTKPKGWVLAKTADGLGYDLIRSGFSIIVR